MIWTVRVSYRTAGNGRRRGALRGQGIDPGFDSLDFLLFRGFLSCGNVVKSLHNHIRTHTLSFSGMVQELAL